MAVPVGHESQPRQAPSVLRQIIEVAVPTDPRPWAGSASSATRVWEVAGLLLVTLQVGLQELSISL